MEKYILKKQIQTQNEEILFLRFQKLEDLKGSKAMDFLDLVEYSQNAENIKREELIGFARIIIQPHPIFEDKENYFFEFVSAEDALILRRLILEIAGQWYIKLNASFLEFKKELKKKENLTGK